MPGKSRPGRGKAQGSVWRKFVRETLRVHGTACWVCYHAGATSADHVIPYTEDDSRALDLANLRPAHGNPHPCATCSSAAGKGIYCNEIKGMGSVERARRKIREMTGLALAGDSDEEPGEREWLFNRYKRFNFGCHAYDIIRVVRVGILRPYDFGLFLKRRHRPFLATL